VANASSKVIAGRYRVLGRLGSGGMATVLLALDERLHREVAIKRMHAESPDDVAKRFRREAKLGAALNHPNIVSVYDIETDDDNVLIVMEHVPGGSLKDAIARGPLPREAALRVLEDVAVALDYAHQHGVVHRDVKPANVLLDNHGNAKLADLGIATAAEVTSITSTGSVLGTAAYMAPERLDGEPGGPAGDIYALATVAYEALTGRKARQGRSAVEIARAVVSEPPPDLRTQMPDAPAAAARVLERGMARDPAARPRSAGDLVADLRAAFQRDRTAATAPLPGRGAAAPAAAAQTGRGGPRRMAPVLALVALLAGAGAVVALTAGGGGAGGSDGSAPRTTNPPASTRAQTQQPATTTTQSTPAPAAKPPADVVRSFYTLAASKDYEAAWALTGPSAREQLGGYDSFVATMGTLESIEFPSLDTTSLTESSATVAFDTVATHTDKVDRCSGTIDLSQDGDSWLIERFDVRGCNSQPRGAAPPSSTPGKGPAGGRPIAPGNGKGKGRRKDGGRNGWGAGGGEG
jgi:eukaryotic-like serine/threonine-protein kinase